MSKEKRLAIVRDVHIGCRDTDGPIMWFDTQIPEATSALQCLSWEEAGELIGEACVSDFTSLNGRPCWVEVGDGLQIFLHLAKM